MLAKYCKCGKLILFGMRMCPDCQAKASQRYKLYDAHARNQKSATFYHSSQWQRLRDVTMANNNYQCAVCRAQGVITPADEVHHIVPIDVDWKLRLTASNLVCLCHRHHMEVHARLKRGAGAGKIV